MDIRNFKWTSQSVKYHINENRFFGKLLNLRINVTILCYLYFIYLEVEFGDVCNMEKAYFNWSSGKDSALALYYAMQTKKFNVDSLFSVIASGENKIAMHEIRIPLLMKQAAQIGIPLTVFHFNESWSTEEYGMEMEKYIEKFKAKGITTALFGDIYLEELRNKRISNCAKSGIKAEFPLWNISPQEILKQFIENGFKAIITCIDNSVLPESFLGKIIDREFMETYPKSADICGENGEYHSFVFDGPLFKKPVDFQIVRKYHAEYADEATGKPRRYCYLELS